MGGSWLKLIFMLFQSMMEDLVLTGRHSRSFETGHGIVNINRKGDGLLMNGVEPIGTCYVWVPLWGARV